MCVYLGVGGWVRVGRGVCSCVCTQCSRRKRSRRSAQSEGLTLEVYIVFCARDMYCNRVSIFNK